MWWPESGSFPKIKLPSESGYKESRNNVSYCGSRVGDRWFKGLESPHLVALSDKLYDNTGGKTADASSSTSGYGTFYPESSATLSAPPTPASSIKKTESYQSMPPPADQQSPYSYGYGDEKKKMLIQGPGEGQTDFSMFSTAYPSSVTGGRGYSGHGGFRRQLRAAGPACARF